jgi:hypothetical protein
MFSSSLFPVVFRRAYVLMMLFALVAYICVQYALTLYMINMSGFLCETGTAHLSRTSEYTPVDLVVSMLLTFFNFLCFPITCLYVFSSGTISA